jgi:hypothetical protein
MPKTVFVKYSCNELKEHEDNSNGHFFFSGSARVRTLSLMLAR